ncbi:CD3337/EF1877 family mobilome membrane protein [Bacillus safensis]|uniref:CD3337/EF1877 family mobilome membrane protein n=1 Tax=Bacillus safensis TaxID=561879 RepID=UPI00046915AE|nr:membrane protein [Bacillus safensis]
MEKQKLKKIAIVTVLLSTVIFLWFLSLFPMTQAAGLVDDTVSEDNLYSLYPMDHYQLDFYVNSDWDWLPWNWDDGIGKQVMYGLYTITNFIWIINLYLSNATGYLVQQAYSLDFISETATAIGQNMQTLAGITTGGFGAEGFYVGFLLLFVLVLGIYVTYTGLMKRETTKAIRAIINFLVVFIVSAAFIAFAPTYITKINDFSADVSEAALDLGSIILMPSSNSQGQDSVDMIRNNLFSIQVEQPWLLLQFDNSDKEAIGEERVNALVSISPDTNNGEDREAAVQAEIENYDNKNLTITKATTRLGMVFFLFLFNIGISIFVFLLSGMMIFSQLLFIIFATFLPISFLLSMIPSFENMAKQAILKLFNVIMLRAGITLIITIAFSISSMLYSLTNTYPFFLIAFLQIVTFAGIYMKLGDIMGMFRLQSSDSQQVGRSVMRRPKQMAYRSGRRLQRSIGRTLTGVTAGATVGKMMSQSGKAQGSFSLRRPIQSLHSMRSNITEKPNLERKSLGQKIGQTTGKVLDTKNRVSANIQHRKQQVKDLPTTTKYAAIKGKERLQQPSKDFKQGITQAKEQRQRENTERTSKHRQTIAEKRQALDKKQKNTAYSNKPTAQKKSPSSLLKEKQKMKSKERRAPESRQRKQVPMPKEEKQALRNPKEKANQPYKESIDRKKSYRKANPIRLPKQTPRAKKQQIIQRPALPRKQTRKQPKPPRQRQAVRRKRP